jgi:hypothetical protein
VDLRTKDACYVQLSNLVLRKTPIDVLAVILNTPSIHKQAEPSGNYVATFYASDTSEPTHPIYVIIYDTSEFALPRADEGDCVLLRNFVVESASHQLYLQSCDISAWCVLKGGSLSSHLVELGGDERKEAQRLRKWYIETCRGRPLANGCSLEGYSYSA